MSVAEAGGLGSAGRRTQATFRAAAWVAVGCDVDGVDFPNARVKTGWHNGATPTRSGSLEEGVR